MKTFLYFICGAMLITLAYWAYKENYRTQGSIRRVTELQRDISEEREAISVLKAEWAYLNRPERLTDLVELNFTDLRLLPLLPEHFADVELIAYPQAQIEVFEVKNPVSVQAIEGEFP